MWRCTRSNFLMASHPLLQHFNTHTRFFSLLHSTADIEPHQGVPRLVTSSRQSRSSSLIRRGLAFMSKSLFATFNILLAPPHLSDTHLLNPQHTQSSTVSTTRIRAAKRSRLISSRSPTRKLSRACILITRPHAHTHT